MKFAAALATLLLPISSFATSIIVPELVSTFQFQTVLANEESIDFEGREITAIESFAHLKITLRSGKECSRTTTLGDSEAPGPGTVLDWTIRSVGALDCKAPKINNSGEMVIMALPPVYDSIRKIQAVLDAGPRLGESIRAIRRVKDLEYAVVGDGCRLRVKLKQVLPPDGMVGPTSYELKEMGELKCD